MGFYGQSVMTAKGEEMYEKYHDRGFEGFGKGDIPLELGKKSSPLTETEKDIKELYRLLYKFLEG